MFPGLLPLLYRRLTYKNARVKTEASFTAEDPWNQGRRTAFTVESYILAPKGTKPKAGPKPPPPGSLRYGIRSDADGVERMLPESLEYLWSNKRVPSEALPRLLKEMTPLLNKADFRQQFLEKGSKAKEYVIIGLFVLILLAIAALTFFFAEDTSDKVFGGGACAFLALLIAGLQYLAFPRPRARRKRQIDWALSHI